MQLVAYLKGERVDATQMAHEAWRDLVNDPDYERLVLIECGLRASRVTRRGRQFFKHYRVADCTIEHKSESDQHLALKRALQDRINATDGWRAEVEHAHPERAWIADVMAIHTSGRRLAFEVQLSAQSEDEYIRRTQRYLDDGIAPVWVSPDNHDEFRVKLPMIVTGFGKTSDLPAVPAALMGPTKFQPLFDGMAQVGTAVDWVLDPRFRWRHGTPNQQLEDLARLDREKAEREAAAKKEAAWLAEERRLAEEQAALEATELAERFIASATAPTVHGVRPVLAAKRLWASEVRCIQAGHPMLIWRLTAPTSRQERPGSADPMWRPSMGTFDNVRAHVDAWLAAAGSSLAKAKVYRVKGWPVRRTFVCPECEQLIHGRWVSALPPAKWSVIAEASLASAEARDVLHRQPPSQPTHSREKPTPGPVARTSR